MADLQVTVTNRSLIKASNTTKEPFILTPSNFDTLSGRSPSRAFFIYPHNPLSSTSAQIFSSVISTVKNSLPQLLNYYFPFAGRFSSDSILCNNAGAELVLAESNIQLSNINFSEIAKSFDRIYIPFDDNICLSVQLVSFPCGGFSVVFATDHLLADAYTLITMFANWAELVRADKISYFPIIDRDMFLKPRTPFKCSHEIDNLYRMVGRDDMVNIMAADVFVKRLYFVDAADLSRLHAVAAEGGAACRRRRPTRMQAFSAYIWKALAKVVANKNEKYCRMGWLVDGRRRMTAADGTAAMRNYAGNFLSYAAAEATVKEVVEMPLAYVARLVGYSINKTANEGHFLDLNGWLEMEYAKNHSGGSSRVAVAEVQLGLGSPAVVVSSLHNVRTDVDFGFGKPALALPLSSGGRHAAGYITIVNHPIADGCWIVMASVWPMLAAELESQALLRPFTAAHSGFATPPPPPPPPPAISDHQVELISRL